MKGVSIFLEQRGGVVFDNFSKETAEELEQVLDRNLRTQPKFFREKFIFSFEIFSKNQINTLKIPSYQGF